MKKMLVVLLCGLLFLIHNANAQTGCVKYYYPGFDAVPVYYPTPQAGTGSYGPNYGGPATSFPSGCYPSEPMPLLSNTGECSLQNPGNGQYTLRGLLVQNHIACAIDNNLIFLLLIAGISGVLIIRKTVHC